MESEIQNKAKKSVSAILIRCLICGIILTGGIAGMSALAGLKSPPPENRPQERPIRVEALVAELESVLVRIKGYGTVRVLNQVKVAPEVSGNVVAVHRRLEKGEIIKKEAVLFKIDPRPYQAAYKEALAVVNQLQNRIDRLNMEYSMDRKRLKTIARNRELGKEHFERIRLLFDSHQIGSQAELDRAEQEYNASVDSYDRMARDIAVFPIQIDEAENDLHAARARLDNALAELERCTVRAPFACRVKDVSLEQHQHVEPGQDVLTLADDSMLEVLVSLDSREVRSWFQFNVTRKAGNNGWFGDIKDTSCSIRWIEDNENLCHKGFLHRVVEFDEATRTITVAVRMADREISASPGSLPLVEGMFCEVTIPGRILENVVRLPAHALSIENTVSVYRAGRLKTVPVQVAREEGEQVFILSGLNPGERVIITRLINPIENALLDVTERGSTTSVGIGGIQ
jgi:RND family efflux transporter MFP subunit